MFLRRRCGKTMTRYVYLLLLFALCMFLYKDKVVENLERQRIARYRQERYEACLQRGFVPGPGENGTAVVLSEEEQKIADKQIANISYNVIAGEKMSLDRRLPDKRPEE